MVTPLKPATRGPFLGLSNRRDDFKLRSSDRNNPGDFLARAENVDITNTGNLKRRAGFVRAIAGSDCHSLWSDNGANDGFFADGTQLKHVTEANGALSVAVVRNDLPLGHRLSYAHDGLGVVYSDGVGVYRILPNGTSVPAAPPLLGATPAVNSSTGGAFPAGTYQVAFVFIDAQGREGGATAASQVTVPQNGAIVITGMPTTYPANVVGITIFLSPPNGDILFNAGTLGTPVSMFSLFVLPALGGECRTRFLAPLPAGTILRYTNGRMHAALGSTVFYSETYMSGLYRPESGFIPFPSPVAVMEALSASLYVVTTTDAYHFNGEITEARANNVMPSGAIPFASGLNEDENSAWWMSTRGLVIGDDSGTVKNHQEAEVVIDPAAAGAGMYAERNGIKQLVVSTFGSQPTQAAVGSWAEAEVIHKAAT